MKELLSSKALTIGYSTPQGENRLFNQLSLTLYGGELVCFMGPNGVGKSTLVRTLAGLQPQLEGTRTSVSEKSVAVVLTDRVAAPLMTVRDLVTLGRYPYLNWMIQVSDADARAIDHALELLQIQHLSSFPISELSDGQMQMALIARAIAQDTPVLLLDEPTSHLDLNNRVEVMNLLRQLAREEGKAVLVATHELDLALQTADKIWLATPERKIKVGIPEDLVLDGSFDEVFQFKGFDLKTGKVTHTPYQNTHVIVEGSGPVLLWTKNALERNGYVISDQGPIRIKCHGQDQPQWELVSDGSSRMYPSLEETLASMKASPKS